MVVLKVLRKRGYTAQDDLAIVQTVDFFTPG
jgi:hypothetical protein